MATSKTLGGDRLGSGKKQKVYLHGFERSTHDLGYVWRNTQAPGTLVPFMTMLALPGDTFDIDLNADVKTHPTLGPLFASFKLQLDVFECPIRLYHSWLHNNKLKIGNDMSKVKLPQFRVLPNHLDWSEDAQIPLDHQHVNPSALLAYLGIRGFGHVQEDTYEEIHKNALPLLSYWDIYKNYYANKQEEIGMFINHDYSYYKFGHLTIDDNGNPVYNGRSYSIGQPLLSGHTYTFNVVYNDDWSSETVILHMKSDIEEYEHIVFTFYQQPDGSYIFTFSFTPDHDTTLWGIGYYSDIPFSEARNLIKLQSFPLENIDTMREDILMHNNSEPFLIDMDTYAPYGDIFHLFHNMDTEHHTNSISSQVGLAIKTYQSDLFNNWLNTEWIDGEGGINEITAVNTEDGSFDINTLNLAQKVYDMLNRIAVSGGTYDDWLEAVYDHESFKKAETPMYHGGLSKEIIFQEVISNSSVMDEDQPLGTLAGKGRLSNKHKGGKVSIKVNEPSYIIGIVSITPRIDYHQGNEFFTNHTTMNDLHKPSLDEIGFQDLVTEKMAWWDVFYSRDAEPQYKSAGKQPAWIDYMTNFNRLYGNFADPNNEMFMTLARNYTPDRENKTIKDLTSYIDPTKYNYAFAQTDLTAQNFWVQIGCDIIARRKMSAKVMPNL